MVGEMAGAFAYCKIAHPGVVGFINIQMPVARGGKGKKQAVRRVVYFARIGKYIFNAALRVAQQGIGM